MQVDVDNKKKTSEGERVTLHKIHHFNQSKLFFKPIHKNSFVKSSRKFASFFQVFYFLSSIGQKINKLVA